MTAIECIACRQPLSLFDLTARSRYNCPLTLGKLPEPSELRKLADLPDLVDPLQLADQGVTLEGSLPLASFERLQDYAPPGELVRVRMRFETDMGLRPLMKGSFSTALTMVCQRCMEQMRLPLEGKFQVFLVRSLDEADRLDDSMDVLQVAERAMRLTTIVEDEVLLAVPAAPLHPLDACSAANAPLPQTVVDAGQQDEQRPNPFAVLAALKHDHDTDEH